MKELLSIVTRKGQITLPIEIRKALGIEEGDKIAFSLDDLAAASVTLRPIRSVAERTFGAIQPRRHPEDFEDLRQRFEQSVSEEALNETSQRKS